MTLFYNDDEINEIRRELKAIKGDRRYRTFMNKLNELFESNEVEVTEVGKDNQKSLPPLFVSYSDVSKMQTLRDYGVRGLKAKLGFNAIRQPFISNVPLTKLSRKSPDISFFEFFYIDIDNEDGMTHVIKPKIDVLEPNFIPLEQDNLTHIKRTTMPEIEQIKYITDVDMTSVDKTLDFDVSKLTFKPLETDNLTKMKPVEQKKIKKKSYILDTKVTHQKRKHIEVEPFRPVIVDMPHVRKMRKQWKGEKRTYNISEFNTVHSHGYAKRSMAKHFPEMTVFNHREIKERMLRSISHTHIKYADITMFKTQQLMLNNALKSAYFEFGQALLKRELNTSPKVDAFYEFIGENKFIDFLNETFEPKLIAFVTLHDKLKRFIAENWNEYDMTSLEARQDKMDMNLTKSQIDALPNADRSYLET